MATAKKATARLKSIASQRRDDPPPPASTPTRSRPQPATMKCKPAIGTSAHARKIAEVRKARNSSRRPVKDPATSDRIYADEEREFLAAMARYQERFHRRFPTWSEVLHVLKELGYRKVSLA